MEVIREWIRGGRGGGGQALTTVVGGSYGWGSIVPGAVSSGNMDDAGQLVYIWDNGEPTEGEDVAIYVVMDRPGKGMRAVQGR